MPSRVGGLQDVVRDPMYATGVGLVLYGDNAPSGRPIGPAEELEWAVLEAGLQALRARPRSDQENPDFALVIAMLLGSLSEIRDRSGHLAQSGALLDEARQLLAGRAVGAARWAEADFSSNGAVQNTDDDNDSGSDD